ncbi:FecR family protein [Niabella ginsengisoli]|uniref:FecR domain-containing protein n=1 Tax=Niabella ginsengisoli TaxID=522298 RepID=A0ABS9SET9_9BACT|nr:FecR domain-containing protein [Niabella ginsengisoli]MCH5596876.1 FecR domain-containing protein [Niabella ginsengisoli]
MPIAIKRWLVAASLVLATGMLFYIYRFNSDDVSPKNIAILTDIAPPQSSRAVLFLENGDTQELHTTKNVVTLPHALVKEKSGTLHTIFNPRGSQPIEFILPDGSRLWLSAESSVTYPAVFDKKQRRIQINGEAYLEVTHDANSPFVVYSGSTEVKVLGTRFNINSFGKETKVTLLEGLITVKSSNDSALIKPGQAAVIKAGLDVTKSDTAAAVAWKNAIFDFRQTDIRDIMQEVARWYDVNIRYEGKVSDITLSGTIDRNTNALRVVEMLALSSGLDFKIEGRTIIVKNQK